MICGEIQMDFDLLLPLPELGTGLSDCDLGLSISNDYLPGMVDDTK